MTQTTVSSSLLSRSTQFTSKTEVIGGIASIVVLVVLEMMGGVNYLQRAIFPIVEPLSQQVIRSANGISWPLRFISQHYSAQQRSQQLAEQLAESEGKIAQLELLQAENKELRSLLENRHLEVKPRRLARPIVSSIVPLVWLGESSDVKEGWIVLYKDTVLGRVMSVNGQYARIGLLASSEDVTMLVQTSGGVKGIARARAGRVTITNVAPEAIVSEGERVVTVGQPGIAPGKFVGLIDEVEKDPNTSSQVIFIDQLVSFYQTTVVEIEE
ncbi:hypothetical protein KA012_01120 [Candidatus Woesebacteria bacterium]|nr:hypothetical protein [Candidatus Woesebacteria bacterium]